MALLAQIAGIGWIFEARDNGSRFFGGHPPPQLAGLLRQRLRLRIALRLVSLYSSLSKGPLSRFPFSHENSIVAFYMTQNTC